MLWVWGNNLGGYPFWAGITAKQEWAKKPANCLNKKAR